MGTIGTIAAIIGAITGIATFWVMTRNTKGSIRRRIRRKQEQVHKIDHKIVLRDGIYGRFPRVITPLEQKRDKLIQDIEELHGRL